MIKKELPDPGKRTTQNLTENVVISAVTEGKYFHPSHTTPFLFIANSTHAGNYAVNKTDITLTGRQFCFLNEGDDLEIIFKEPLSRHTLMILFNYNFISGMIYNKLTPEKQLLETPEQSTENFQIPSIPFFMNEPFRQQLNKIKNYSSPSSDDLDNVLANVISEFLQINDDTAKQLNKINAAKRSTREELYRRLAVALCYMHDNITASVTIEQIATAACMNRFHLLRTFKKVYGITPHRFLLQLKLQKAHGWLKNEKRPVTEVCYDLGFESIGSFSNLFKDHFGFPPSQLLRNY